MNETIRITDAELLNQEAPIGKRIAEKQAESQFLAQLNKEDQDLKCIYCGLSHDEDKPQDNTWGRY